MSFIDWTIVAGFLLFLILIACYTRSYAKSVADFLAAGRCSGRYLLCVSMGVAGIGAITVIGNFEMFYKAGFTAAWGQIFLIVTQTLVMVSGWVLYRFRETRCLTLAEFFERRYSRKFRIFAGFIAWGSGIVNFGIFPAVGARFVKYFCGFESREVMILGIWNVDLVFAAIIVVLLAIALFFTYMGGQITVLITDFLQGTFSNIMFVVILLVVMWLFPWKTLIEGISIAPEAESKIHPFKIFGAEDFNIWFFFIMAYSFMFGDILWQGAQAYNACGLNAHETRMGKILSTWRLLPMNLFVMVLPLCAYTVMHHPYFQTMAGQIQTVINGIENPQIQEQLTPTIAIRRILPKGITGGFVAVMLAAFISTHDTYMHSWGSIFIQDVIMPFRKKPFTPKQHMHLLRFSILGVTIFIFFFSLIFRQTEYIFMFFRITGAIFLGGAGAAVIGGLYWKKGTALAAWSAMITGSTLSVGAVILRQIHTAHPFTGLIGHIASQNGAVLSFYASITAIAVYIIISLVQNKSVNMDKILHRGEYAIEKPEKIQALKPVNRFRKIIAMGSEFSLTDKLIYLATLAWTSLLVIIFVIGTLYNLLIKKASDQSWLVFWRYYIWALVGMSILTTVWFTIGGLVDIKKMFKLLKSKVIDESDDGWVHKSQKEEIQK